MIFKANRAMTSAIVNYRVSNKEFDASKTNPTPDKSNNNQTKDSFHLKIAKSNSNNNNGAATTS